MGSTWKTDPQYAACSLYSAENAELRAALEQTAFALAQAAIDKAKS